jgi:hypothetical protein
MAQTAALVPGIGHRLINLFDLLFRIQEKENDLKILYCRVVTPMALKLIRRFDGDIIGDKAIICNFSREEPSKDKNGRIVDGAFRIFFPNNQAICYTLSGEISFVL